MAIPRAALGQFCATHDLLRNLKSCQTLVEKAVAANASALFLPEASDYISRSPAESISLCQPPSSSAFVLGLRSLARTHSLPISVGIHEPTDDGKQERIKNTTIYIDAAGEIAQRYQKIHVFDVDIAGGPKLIESATTEPGSSLTQPFSTPIGKLGMLICFDMRFPEPSLALRRLGAELIGYPSAFTVPTGRAHWEVLLRARAIETQAYVLAPAQVGSHNEKRTSWGQTMVVDPWGRVVAMCRSHEEPGTDEPEICVADIDLGIVEKTRKEVPLKRRFDVYPEV